MTVSWQSVKSLKLPTGLAMRLAACPGFVWKTTLLMSATSGDVREWNPSAALHTDDAERQ